LQNDACIQTLGVEEPENTSLRHINGKLQITKATNMSQRYPTNNTNNKYNILNQNVLNEQLSLHQQSGNSQYSNRFNNNNGVLGLTESNNNNNNNNNMYKYSMSNSSSNNSLSTRKQQVPPPLLDFSFKQQKNYDPNYYNHGYANNSNHYHPALYNTENTYNTLESSKSNSSYSRPNIFYNGNKIEDQYYQSLNTQSQYPNHYQHHHNQSGQYHDSGPYYPSNNTHQKEQNFGPQVTNSPFYYTKNNEKLLSPPLESQRLHSTNNENSPISPSRYYQPKLLVKHASPSQYKIAEIQNTALYVDEHQQIFNSNKSQTPKEEEMNSFYEDVLVESDPVVQAQIVTAPPKTRSRKSSKSSFLPNNLSLANTNKDTQLETTPLMKPRIENHDKVPSAKPRANTGNMPENPTPIVVPNTPSAKPRVKANEKSLDTGTFFIEVTPKTFTTEVMEVPVITSIEKNNTLNEKVTMPRRPAFIDPSVVLPIKQPSLRPKDRKSKSLNPQPKPRHSHLNNIEDISTNTTTAHDDYSTYDYVDDDDDDVFSSSNKITSLPEPSSSSSNESAGEENISAASSSSSSEFSSSVSSSSSNAILKQEIYSTRFKTSKNKPESIYRLPASTNTLVNSSSTTSSPSSSSSSRFEGNNDEDDDDEVSCGLVSSLSPQFDTSPLPSSSSSLLTSTQRKSTPKTTTTSNTTHSLSTIESYASSSSSFISSSSNSMKTSKNNAIVSSQKENFGHVNQIKNEFETTCDLPIKNEKLQKSHAKLNFDLLSPPSTPTKLKKFNVKINIDKSNIDADSSIKNDVEKTPTSEYMNCSNKYLTLKAKSLVRDDQTMPPPLAPPFPPTPPPPLNTSSLSSPLLKQTQQTVKTTDNLVAKLITSSSSPRNKQAKISNQSEQQPSVISSGSSNQTNAINSTRPARLMSNASSNYTMQSVKLSTEFRILSSSNHQSERSTATSGGGNATQQINVTQQLKMVQHLPDSVDVVKLNFEGQRRVVVPGYMTSADILRNMLLKNNNTSGFDIKPAGCGSDLTSVAPLIVKRQGTGSQMSLKEKLLMQNRKENFGGFGDEFNQTNNQQRTSNHNSDHVGISQKDNIKESPREDLVVNATAFLNNVDEEDLELAKKFSRKNRTRSMSGLVTLDLSNNQNMQIIDIDFDYDDSKKQNTTLNTSVPISKSNGNIQQNKTDTLFGNKFVFF
jgi:hypothetical protein